MLVKAHDPDEALAVAAAHFPRRCRPTAAVPAAQPVARAVLAGEPLPPQSRSRCSAENLCRERVVETWQFARDHDGFAASDCWGWGCQTVSRALPGGWTLWPWGRWVRSGHIRPDGRLLASTTLGFGATRLWDSARRVLRSARS